MGHLPSGFLALPAATDRTSTQLLRKVRLLALRRILTGDVPRLRRPLAGLQSALVRIARSKQKASLVRAVGAIDVLAPTLALESELTDGETAVRALVPQLLFELWRHDERVSDTILWDVPVERLVDAAGGNALSFEPPAKGMLLDPSGIELCVATGERLALSQHLPTLASERVLHPVTATTHLATLDTNPLAPLEAHPDKHGNAVDLGAHPPSAWCAALDEASSLIEAALPSLAAEIAETLQRIVPVGYDAARHFSASYREAPGLIYLSLHPSPLTLAEAIVHETQHGKLNALSWFDPLLKNGRDTWTSSPIRPDLRPLIGVLMAVHAFVPVAALHRRLVELAHPASSGAGARHEEVVAANATGLETLRALGRPTALGERVIRALEALHEHVVGDRRPRGGDIAALG